MDLSKIPIHGKLDRSHELYIVQIIFLSVAAVCVLIRGYIKCIVIRVNLLDDYLIYGAMVRIYPILSPVNLPSRAFTDIFLACVCSLRGHHYRRFLQRRDRKTPEPRHQTRTSREIPPSLVSLHGVISIPRPHHSRLGLRPPLPPHPEAMAPACHLDQPRVLGPVLNRLLFRSRLPV